MEQKTIHKLKLYEEVMLRKRECEAELEALKDDLLREIPHDKEIRTEQGVFSVGSKAKWEYSDKVANLQKEVDELKAREQADGSATKGAGAPYIMYRENKNEGV